MIFPSAVYSARTGVRCRILGADEPHFEQNFHVCHRLDRFEAGRCMDFDRADPSAIAVAIVEELGRPVASKSVDAAGAARVAKELASLL